VCVRVSVDDCQGVLGGRGGGERRCVWVCVCVCVCVCACACVCVCVRVFTGGQRGAEGRVLQLHWISIAVSLLRVAHT